MRSRSYEQFDEQKMRQFPHCLIYPFLEWILIIMLFIDGLISFAANEFAHLFGLKIPCLFCTRIDHVLLQSDPNSYYNECICESHRQHVSSLAFCKIHNKFSDILLLCDDCRPSFTTGNKSVESFSKDLKCSIEDDDNGIRDSLQNEKISFCRCPCCGDSTRIRSSFSQELGQISSPNGGKFPQARKLLNTMKNEESRDFDPLSTNQNTQLRSKSEPESKIPEIEVGSNASVPDNQCIKGSTLPLMAVYDDLNEDSCKTPSSTRGRGNRFFGISLTDSASDSPRWNSRFPRVELVTANGTNSETILDCLKRQVHLDHKSLKSLCIELDEERNASEVAVNQAMAMITRLQEEKAAVQMEALQYQRMMEEQAVYEEESLQFVKDLLIKREEEIKFLKAEVQSYRDRFEDGSGSDNNDPIDSDCQKLKTLSSSYCDGEFECGSSPNLDELENNGEFC